MDGTPQSDPRVLEVVTNLSNQLQATTNSLISVLGASSSATPSRPVPPCPRNVINNVINSPASQENSLLTRIVRNSTHNVTPVPPPVQTAANVNAAVNSLFIRNAKHASDIEPSSKKKKVEEPAKNAEFSKEVILLRSSTIQAPLSKAEREKHRTEKRIINSFSFKRWWTEAKVREELSKAFPVLKEQEFEILLPENGSLIVPNLYGTELSGTEISRMFQKKTIYIRVLHNSVADSSDEEDSDIFKERVIKSRRNKVILVDGLSEGTPQQPVPSTSGTDPTNQIESDYRLALSLASDDTVEEESLNNDIDADEMCSDGNSVTGIISKAKNKNCPSNNEDQWPRISVSRARPIESLERYVSSESFNVWGGFKVFYSGECGADTGGVRRDFLDELLNHIKNSPMFTGEGNRKYIEISISHLQRKHYFLAGVAVKLSLIHQGPTPNFLHPNLFKIIVGRDDVDFQIDDIFLPEWRRGLTRLKEATTVEEARTVLTEEAVFSQMKSDPFILEMGEVEFIIEDSLEFYFRHRLAAPISQFTDGLNCGGFLATIKQNSILFYHILVGNDDKLTKAAVENLFYVYRSPMKTPEYATEVEILTNWDWLLSDLEAGINSNGLNLQDLLKFLTGTRVLPVGGLPKKIDIEFAHGTTKSLPEAFTCGLHCKLPVVHIDYENFKKYMLMALQEGSVFSMA